MKLYSALFAFILTSPCLCGSLLKNEKGHFHNFNDLTFRELVFTGVPAVVLVKSTDDVSEDEKDYLVKFVNDRFQLCNRHRCIILPQTVESVDEAKDYAETQLSIPSSLIGSMMEFPEVAIPDHEIDKVFSELSSASSFTRSIMILNGPNMARLDEVYGAYKNKTGLFIFNGEDGKNHYSMFLEAKGKISGSSYRNTLERLIREAQAAVDRARRRAKGESLVASSQIVQWDGSSGQKLLIEDYESTGRPILVMRSGTYCGPCTVFKGQLRSLERRLRSEGVIALIIIVENEYKYNELPSKLRNLIPKGFVPRVGLFNSIRGNLRDFGHGHSTDYIFRMLGG